MYEYERQNLFLDLRAPKIIHLKDPTKSQNNLEIAKRAMSTNKNLDLRDYDAHLREFLKFSSPMFEMDNIFKVRKKNLSAQLVAEHKSRRKYIEPARTSSNAGLFDPNPLHTFQTFHPQVSNAKAAQARRANEKHVPTGQESFIKQEEFDLFNGLGQIGWKYIQEQLLMIRNHTLMDNIKYLHRFNELRRFIARKEQTREKLQNKLESLQRDPNYFNRIMKDYDSFKIEILREYKKEKRRLRDLRRERQRKLREAKESPRKIIISPPTELCPQVEKSPAQEGEMQHLSPIPQSDQVTPNPNDQQFQILNVNTLARQRQSSVKSSARRSARSFRSRTQSIDISRNSMERKQNELKDFDFSSQSDDLSSFDSDSSSVEKKSRKRKKKKAQPKKQMSKAQFGFRQNTVRSNKKKKQRKNSVFNGLFLNAMGRSLRRPGGGRLSVAFQNNHLQPDSFGQSEKAKRKRSQKCLSRDGRKPMGLIDKAIYEESNLSNKSSQSKVSKDSSRIINIQQAGLRGSQGKTSSNAIEGVSVDHLGFSLKVPELAKKAKSPNTPMKKCHNLTELQGRLPRASVSFHHPSKRGFNDIVLRKKASNDQPTKKIGGMPQTSQFYSSRIRGQAPRPTIFDADKVGNSGSDSNPLLDDKALLALSKESSSVGSSSRTILTPPKFGLDSTFKIPSQTNLDQINEEPPSRDQSAPNTMTPLQGSPPKMRKSVFFQVDEPDEILESDSSSRNLQKQKMELKPGLFQSIFKIHAAAIKRQTKQHLRKRNLKNFCSAALLQQTPSMSRTDRFKKAKMILTEKIINTDSKAQKGGSSSRSPEDTTNSASRIKIQAKPPSIFKNANLDLEDMISDHTLLSLKEATENTNKLQSSPPKERVRIYDEGASRNVEQTRQILSLGSPPMGNDFSSELFLHQFSSPKGTMTATESLNTTPKNYISPKSSTFKTGPFHLDHRKVRNQLDSPDQALARQFKANIRKIKGPKAQNRSFAQTQAWKAEKVPESFKKLLLSSNPISEQDSMLNAKQSLASFSKGQIVSNQASGDKSTQLMSVSSQQPLRITKGHVKPRPFTGNLGNAMRIYSPVELKGSPSRRINSNLQKGFLPSRQEQAQEQQAREQGHNRNLPVRQQDLQSEPISPESSICILEQNCAFASRDQVPKEQTGLPNSSEHTVLNYMTNATSTTTLGRKNLTQEVTAIEPTRNSRPMTSNMRSSTQYQSLIRRRGSPPQQEQAAASKLISSFHSYSSKKNLIPDVGWTQEMKKTHSLKRYQIVSGKNLAALKKPQTAPKQFHPPKAESKAPPVSQMSRKEEQNRKNLKARTQANSDDGNDHQQSIDAFIQDHGHAVGQRLPAASGVGTCPASSKGSFSNFKENNRLRLEKAFHVRISPSSSIFQKVPRLKKPVQASKLGLLRMSHEITSENAAQNFFSEQTPTGPCSHLTSLLSPKEAMFQSKTAIGSPQAASGLIDKSFDSIVRDDHPHTDLPQSIRTSLDTSQRKLGQVPASKMYQPQPRLQITGSVADLSFMNGRFESKVKRNLRQHLVGSHNS